MLTLAKIRGAIAGLYIDRIVAVSNFVHRRSVDYSFLKGSKVRTIYNGIDCTRYKPAPVGKRGSSPLTVAFVGRLIPEKGIHLLLQATSSLMTGSSPRFKLLIAGRGKSAAELRQYCEDEHLGSVEFLGHIDWIPELLSSADIVVMPSECDEGFSYTVAEAMACGSCVLVSDRGAMPEAVGSGGEAGMTFRRGDAEDLAQKLGWLLQSADRRSDIGAKARVRIVNEFSIERMLNQYCSLFDELR